LQIISVEVDAKREFRHRSWDCRPVDSEGDHHNQQIRETGEKGVGENVKINWKLKGFDNCPYCRDKYQSGQALVELQCGVLFIV